MKKKCCISVNITLDEYHYNQYLDWCNFLNISPDEFISKMAETVLDNMPRSLQGGKHGKSL